MLKLYCIYIFQLSANSVKASLNGTHIQCTFGATIPDSSTRYLLYGGYYGHGLGYGYFPLERSRLYGIPRIMSPVDKSPVLQPTNKPGSGTCSSFAK